MVTDAQLAAGATYFAAAVGVLCVLLALLLLAIFRPRRTNGSGYVREVPDDLPPAVVGALSRKDIVSEAEIAATLLDLTAKRLLRADPVRLRITGIMGGGEVKTLSFSLVDGAWERMHPLDRELYGMLVRVTGGTAAVSVEALRSAARGRTGQFRREFAHWQAAVDAEAASRGLLRRGARSARWALVAAALMALMLGAFSSMVATSLVPLVMAGGGAAVAVGVSYLLSPLTSAGAEVLGRYHALRRYLVDFGALEDDPPQAVEIWSQYLSYATLFGIADRSLTALDMRLPGLMNAPDLEPFRVWASSH